MTKTTRTALLAGIAVAALVAVAATYNFIGRAEATEAASKAPAAGQSNQKLQDLIKDDTVYATFGDQKITGKDVRQVIGTLPPQLQAAPADRVLTLLVNQLVNDRLVDISAEEMKLSQDKLFKERLSMAEKQIKRELFLEKKLEGKITDKAIEEKYNQLVKEVPLEDEVRASHILVSDEKTAKEVLAKLEKGEDFVALAKQYSIDPSKEQGGDLGYFVKSAMVKEFGEAAFAMSKGEVSKVPVKTQFGFHIIKVVDKRKQKPPALAEVRDPVRGRLAEEAIRAIVEELRAKQKIDFNLPEPAAPAKQ